MLKGLCKGLCTLLVALLLGSRLSSPPAAVAQIAPINQYAGIFLPESHLESLQLLNDAGFGWERMTFRWSLTQTVPPAGCDPRINWNYQNVEQRVNAAVAAGRKVILTLRGTPAWAVPGGSPGGTRRVRTQRRHRRARRRLHSSSASLRSASPAA